MSAYPKSLLSIVASVGAVAVFLVLASLFMVSQPPGPTFGRFFYGINHSENFDSMSLVNGIRVNPPSDLNITKDMAKSNLSPGKGDESLGSSDPDVKTFADPTLQTQHPVSENTYKKSMSGQNVNLSLASFHNTNVSNPEDVVDQPREKFGASIEGKVDGVSLSANKTVKVPQLSKEVSSSVSLVQDISKTHSSHSGIAVHHIFLFYTCKTLFDETCFVAFLYTFGYLFSLSWPIKLFTEFFFGVTSFS